MRTQIYLLSLVCFCIVVSAGCHQNTRSGASAAQGRIDIAKVISWLPTDTETLLVANGPFWMSNFLTGEERNYSNREVKSEELEKQFEGQTLSLIAYRSTGLEKRLEGKKVLFALEASRHFRPPAGLGEMPFEGCVLAVFKDDLRDRRDAFMKNAEHSALRVDEVEGLSVAVFKERSEEDLWTTFVVFPQDGVLLVATNEDFLREILARIGGAKGERALPDTLREWKYVNTKAQFWGLRHFDKTQATKDPTSPFEGTKSANIPDDAAVGLTYECNPSKVRKATITYLSGPGANVRKIAERMFPAASEPEATAGLNIQYRTPETGVIQSQYDLSHSQPIDWFIFTLMGNLGHAVYL